MNTKRSFALAVALCAASIVTPAFAATSDAMTDQAESVQVRWDDLNLASETGQEQLDRRIDAAARKSCKADVIPAGYRSMHPVTRQCVADAKASAAVRVAELVSGNRTHG